jgi:hypothetical protein
MKSKFTSRFDCGAGFTPAMAGIKPALQHTRKNAGGFALVLTVALLALLTLAVYALSSLARVNAQFATAAEYRVQAQQNARLGLAQAIGALQTLAGPDDRVTAMAGIAGAVGGTQVRHWCGVWQSDGTFLGWLTSGANVGSTPSLAATDVVQLVEKNTVGPKPATVSAYVDEEYVDAGKIPIIAPDPGVAPATVGSYAFWVGDEGVKVSLWAPSAQWPGGGTRIPVASTPTNIARMGTAFQQFDTANAARVLAYAQSTNLYYASGSRLTASNLHDSFHHTTLSHLCIDSSGTALVIGQVNLNTTSAVVWRSLIEAYEAAPGATPFGSSTKRTSAINTLANGIASSTSGKNSFAPFVSVEAFLDSSLLRDAITGINGITVEQFTHALTSMLTVRSDTFRIRAYGEATNPAESTRLEATAWCEAIVQRTTAPAAGALGRKFLIVSFRWLGPDDV